ncbi:caspase family protein [Gloeobacter kilaueensis]|uniref:WD-40 repeat-containing protein n=1 Tax=Gloeobacter kilaueensis (strain ATCC BAA-2537 / CCAP 1431/1 / ULC 316 / JS1) TaxID=1183438 RepID=U5QPB1_GLOK1|nr:caspase family protein [Gloeobacter kilaueensis]AGY59419.1 WD-40 repeat-containing protein [Gloeobacter kilaueensis JS1]
MPPVGIRSTQSKQAQVTEEGRLWLLLVGVNTYRDPRLPTLRYCVADCRGIAAALQEANRHLAAQTAFILHDEASEAPTLANVRSAVEQIVALARPQDTVLFYFCGHGTLEPVQRRAVLCLADTDQDDLLATGLELRRLLAQLGRSVAAQQIIWLDACHSGGVNFGDLATGNGRSADPNGRMEEILREQAARSRGFYAMLSCNQGQRSWEFSELGHGLFTYFLMHGLQGAAANFKGEIEVDNLYHYVCRQVGSYIENRNQQVRYLNRQRRRLGQSDLLPDYARQEPKRIVEGVGNLRIGLRSASNLVRPPRRAIIAAARQGQQIALDIGRKLAGAGQFEPQFWPAHDQDWSELRHAIQSALQPRATADTSETVLLYLRGRIERGDEGEWLVLGGGLRLSAFWLLEQMRQSPFLQQVLIFDCPGAENLAGWTDRLVLGPSRSQCLIAAASPVDDPDRFARLVFSTLAAADIQTGLSAARWISQLQQGDPAIELHERLSGETGIIEILPGGSAGEFQTSDLNLCPYMGLRAFGEEDAPYFFGREGLSHSLTNRLATGHFLAISGASGSGKSSLLHAGVLPRLRSGNQIPGSEHWWIASFRPGEKPMVALAHALGQGSRSAEDCKPQEVIEGLLHLGAKGLLHWLTTRPEPVVLLVIDQFEELFTLAGPAQTQALLQVLLEALPLAEGRLKIAVTLRLEYMDRCLRTPLLGPLFGTGNFLLRPQLERQDYREIICKPAQQVGLQVDPALVEALLQELGNDSGALPLLEFALELIWQVRSEGRLSLQAYEQEVGRLEGAVEKRAQKAYQSLSAEQKACARWIFLSLTQLGEGTEDTRRLMRKADLLVPRYSAELVDRTLGALEDAKLVIVDRGSNSLAFQSRAALPGDLDAELETFKQEVTVEVVHEILIQHWSTLRTWLDENRDRLRTRRQIEQATSVWLQNHRQAGFLLPEGQLPVAEELYEQQADELSEDVRQFIAACLAKRDREREQTHRRLRLAQIVAGAMAALAVIAAGAGLVAWKQVQEVQHSHIQTLLSESKLLMANHKQLEALSDAVLAAGLSRQYFSGDEKLSDEATQTLQPILYAMSEANRLTIPTGKLTSASFSPDEKMIAAADTRGFVHLWQQNGQPLKTWRGHSDFIWKIAFSPDSQTIATSSYDRTARLWALNGKLLKTFTGHANPVHDVAFSPNGKTIATLSKESIRIWNRDGKLLRTITQNLDDGQKLAFSPDSKSLAIATRKLGTFELRSIDGAYLKIFKWQKQFIDDVAFSPDGKTLATVGRNRSIQLWDISGKLLHVYRGHTDAIESIAFSPDSQTLATAAWDKTIRLWSTNGEALQTLKGHTDTVMHVRFSSRGDRLLSAGLDKTVRIWQLQNKFSQNFFDSGTTIKSIRFSPDSSRFVSIDSGNNVLLWNRRGQLLAVLRGHTAEIQAIDISPDGEFIVSAGNDRTVRTWSKEGKLLRTVYGHTEGITTVSFLRDGKIISASYDKSIHLLDQSGKLLRIFRGHKDDIFHVLDLSGAIVSFSRDNTVRWWKLDGKQVKVLSGFKAATCIDAETRIGIFAVGDSDGTVSLWDRNGKQIRTIKKHTSQISVLKFNPRNQTLASADAGGVVRIWNLKGELLATLHDRDEPITRLQFSPDGKTLLTAADNGKIHVWNLDIEQFAVLNDSEEIISALAFSPDSKSIVSGSNNGQLLLWKQWQPNQQRLLNEGCHWLSNYTSQFKREEQEVLNVCGSSGD